MVFLFLFGIFALNEHIYKKYKLPVLCFKYVEKA